MKSCITCKNQKPLSEFYKDSRYKGGHINECKTCIRERSRRNSSKPHRKEAMRLSSLDRYYRTERVETRARKLLNRVVAAGKIKKEPCKKCGYTKVEAHHDDYTKPLEIIWLCRRHHILLHKTFKL